MTARQEKQKVRFTLLSGTKLKDFEQLMKFYEQLTGRKPTAQELEEARKEFGR